MDHKQQKNEKIDATVKANVQRCLLWCNKYNVPPSPFFKDTHANSVPLGK
jgi:hypothetical protein